MNNLVARLRAVAENQSRVTGGVVRVDTNVFSQAADEIERLDGRIDRLLAALKALRYGTASEIMLTTAELQADEAIAEEKEQSK